jgi:ribonuclease Z
MQAKNCLLTHFSARYPKLPPLTPALPSLAISPSSSPSPESIEPIVAIAFDMATLRLDEFWKVQRFGEAMRGLFKEDEGDGEGEGDDCTI